VGIAKSFKVVSIEMSICNVLQKALELSQINFTDHLVKVGVHDSAPVHSARSLLKCKLGRHGHQVGGEQVVFGVRDALN